MDTTEHDLKLLSIGYYIQAGIVGFYSLMMLAYMSFIGTILTAVARDAQQHGRPAIPPGIISLVSVIAAIALILCVAYAVCHFLAGYWIRRHRNWVFVYVVAALACLGIPYGTVLGIFTFMVMQRSAAQRLFGRPVFIPPIPQQAVPGPMAD